jgi:D-amino-acid dehydrogenase
MLPQPPSSSSSNIASTSTHQENNTTNTKRVVVCGAGIIGLTTCYYLAKLGHEVVCVEKESSVGTQISYCNGAFLDPALYTSWADLGVLFRIGERYRSKLFDFYKQKYSSDPATDAIDSTGSNAADAVGFLKSDDTSIQPLKQQEVVGKPMRIELSALTNPFFWKWGLQFLLNGTKEKANQHGRIIRSLGFYSMSKLQEFQSTHPTVLMHQFAQGTIEIFQNLKEFQFFLKSDRFLHLTSTKQLQKLTKEQAYQLEPSLCKEIYNMGAIFSPKGTNGDVHELCQHMKTICSKEGVMFRFRTEITDFCMKKGAIVALETKQGECIQGDAFVLALGNETCQLARKANITLNMYPIKGYILSVPVNEGFCLPKHNIYAGGQALVSPLANGIIRISGGVDFCNPKVVSKQNQHEKRFEWLLNQAKILFPTGYFNTKAIQQHVCYRPVTADDVPMIGQTTIPNLYINTGHGSKGFTMAFGAGALLADEITGIKPHLDMKPFDPHRFNFVL